MLILGIAFSIYYIHNQKEINSAQYEHLLDDKKKFPFIKKALHKAGEDGKISNGEFHDIHDIIIEYNKGVYKEDVMNKFSEE